MRLSHIILLFVVVCALASCSHQKVEERGMYYWRTSLNLSKGERAFLQQHHVGRLYVRYFDVVCDDAGHSQPNATLSFDDSLPAGLEIVPTVYILNDCMRHDDPLLAERILKRVRQMNETNDVGPLKELQVDCDWTMQTATLLRFPETAACALPEKQRAAFGHHPSAPALATRTTRRPRRADGLQYR